MDFVIKETKVRIFVFLVPVTVSVKLINPVVAEHSSVVLSCHCNCSELPQWLKNSQSVLYWSPFAPRSPYMLLANGSLRINASRYTAGNYSCEIHTSYWTVRSQDIKLDVHCRYH